MPTVRDFLFGFKFAATDGVSPVLSGIAQKIENLTKTSSKLGAVVKGLGDLSILGGLGEGMKVVVERASAMQSVTARLAATTGLSAKAIGALQAHADSFSETNFGATAEQYVGAFQKMYQVTHSIPVAMRAADNAFRLSEATGASYESTVGLINAAHENLGVSSTAVAEGLAGVQRQFAIGQNAMDGFTYAVARMSGAAKIAHTTLPQLLALAGEANQLLPGGRGAQLMASLVQGLPAIAAKAHLSMAGGLVGVLEQIHARTASYSGEALQRALSSMGAKGREAAELVPLLDNIKKIRAASESIKINGAADLGSAIGASSNTYAAQMAIFGHAISNLEVVLGGALLPDLTAMATSLTAVVSATRSFADEHPAVGKMVIGLGAVAALGASLSLVGTALSFVGGGLALIPAGAALASTGMTEFSAAVGVVTASMEGLTLASLAFNPLAWAALAAGAAALIYEYWGPIKHFFTAMVPEFYHAGVIMMEQLGAGLMAKISAPIHAAEHIAGRIKDFFVGHSPPPSGPLHHLNHVRIIETIADTMKPYPAIAAATRVAQAVALAVPLTMTPMLAGAALAGPRIAPRVSLAAPASSYASGRSEGACGNVVIKYSPIINIGPGADAKGFREALREHSRDLVDIMQRELDHRSRRSF
ncbi:MAG: phage tail tape measure protein [Candidatus Binataceae bacterium]